LVGPNYGGAPRVAPEAVSSRAFLRASDAAAAAPVAHWWTALGDERLSQLIDDAFAASPDIEIARARLQQSRANLHKSDSGLLPNTEVSAIYLRSKGLTTAFSGASAGATAALDFYDVGFDATWELDLFGGQRRAIEGARAQAQAARANFQDAQVSLAAEVAEAYVKLRGLQQIVALAQKNVAIETRILELGTLRQKGGAASDLDLERLNNQLQSTRADVIPTKAQITQALDRLAILTGRAPGALDAQLTPPGSLPLPPATVAVGDPASMLRRRPDVRSAERVIAQKNALIGQRTADLFPKVEFLGNLGYGAQDPSNLFNSASFSNVILPTLQWRPFDFGRTRASIAEANGERAEAVAAYRKTVLSALEDAETALSRYGRQRESVATLAHVEASAENAARMTALRVKGGTATTIDVLDAERQRVTAEASLSQARTELTQDYISLQKSLGLGWTS
jgi:NodT family efflux transporter outer membrane factor (OMF) lipoprotein